MMRAKLLDYNTGKHYDISKFFSEAPLKEAYYIKTNRDIIESVFEDVKLSTKIVYRDDDLTGYEEEFYTLAHAARIKINNGIVEISEIAENAIKTIGKNKLTHFFMETKELPYRSSEKLAAVLTEYADLMQKPKEEIAREIIKRLSKS